ncbi:hypothetical protein Taro_028847 [Colocasia esculenta]|uniref:Uncharacterized protein n=1 Tax=Colocasia esculenta TaxID=4460 RepID=A0A843VHG7_COLES|nr:hypothetical protein [Colocasia esculenta]
MKVVHHDFLYELQLESHQMKREKVKKKIGAVGWTAQNRLEPVRTGPARPRAAVVQYRGGTANPAFKTETRATW